MTFDIQKSIKLLSPEYFEQAFNLNNCQHLVSIFQDAYHNFIIPDPDFAQVDATQNSKLLEKFNAEGKLFSYYIPKEIEPAIESLVTSTGLKRDGDTRYVFKNISEQYQIPDHQIIKLEESNLEQFLEAAIVCFPGWENESFTRWCLNCPAVEMLALTIEGKIAAFAGYFTKPGQDYVLLMNAGTLPEFRRQGFHEYMIKKRVNEILALRESATFYSDVDDGGASHLGFTKLGFEDGPVYAMYN